MTTASVWPHCSALQTEHSLRLIEKTSEWPCDLDLADLNVERLQQIATVHGVDFATALLYDRITHSPRHRQFAQQLAETENITANMTARQKQWRKHNVLLAVVPGALYQEYPYTGADGRLIESIAARLGCPTERVPLPSFGSLKENANILCEWLQTRSGQKIVLAALSKGASDVKYALSQPRAEEIFCDVVLWINFSGILWGTPLVRWIRARPWLALGVRLLCWRWRYRYRTFCELDRRTGGALDFSVRLPAHLPAVCVAGFPTINNLSDHHARKAHRRLSALGPNDGGGVLLGDLTRFPGYVFPVWGADHYLRGNWNADLWIGRLLNFAVERTVIP